MLMMRTVWFDTFVILGLQVSNEMAADAQGAHSLATDTSTDTCAARLSNHTANGAADAHDHDSRSDLIPLCLLAFTAQGKRQLMLMMCTGCLISVRLMLVMLVLLAF